MAVRIVRLGMPRAKNEGTRIGTVRRPPRGVRKDQFAAQDWYDVWYPNLAPSADLVKIALQAETQAQRVAFRKKYRAQMRAPDVARTIALLAKLSAHSNFSVGCYCEDISRCHRLVLRDLLLEQGAVVHDKVN